MTKVRTVKEIKKCSCCSEAKNGEPLYKYNNELYCAFCIAALMVETNSGVESDGFVGDEVDK